MASQGLPPLPLRLCALYFLLLMFGMSNKFKSGVSCSETLHPNVSDFAANDHLQMVTKAPTTPPPPPPLPTFNRYFLALQWPPSLCKSKTCRKDKTVPRYFTIHGLWPDTTQEYCTGEKFDFFQVFNLAKQLDVAWPSLFESKTQQAFLGHEWEKHGTCSGLSQYDYFKLALDLHGSVNVYNRLVAINFGPGSNKKYNPSDIITAYEKKYSLKIRIICVKIKGSTGEMIGEIHFQVNKISKTVESITGWTTSCTQSTVSFPDK